MSAPESIWAPTSLPLSMTMIRFFSPPQFNLFAKCIAQLKPEGPAPTTKTSVKSLFLSSMSYPHFLTSEEYYLKDYQMTQKTVFYLIFYCYMFRFVTLEYAYKNYIKIMI